MINSKRRNRGITLVETIASVIIAATIASLILSFLSSSFKNFNETEKALQLQNNSQATMNIMMDNIMSSSKVIGANKIINTEVAIFSVTPIKLNEAHTADTKYNLDSISFSKELEGVVIEETYTYDNTKRQIIYNRKKAGVPETSGVLASNLDKAGFILHVSQGTVLGEAKYVTIELKFVDDDHKINLVNTARFRNSN